MGIKQSKKKRKSNKEPTPTEEISSCATATNNVVQPVISEMKSESNSTDSINGDTDIKQKLKSEEEVHSTSTEDEQLEIATFALGWFWFPEAQFGGATGVVRTCVGYSGGKELNPSYHNLLDHSESVQIHFNPKIISYKDLLGIFFNSHDVSTMHSRQYRSAIFYHSTEQETLALYYKQNLEKKGRVRTAIETFTKFYPAEDYHQKIWASTLQRGN